TLDPATAAMAKLWSSETEGWVIDELLQIAWRLRLYERVPDRAHVRRRAHRPHLWWDQRDHEGGNRPRPMTSLIHAYQPNTPTAALVQDAELLTSPVTRWRTFANHSGPRGDGHILGRA